MAIKDYLKITRKTFFDPRAWIGYDLLKDHTVFLGRYFKNVFGSLFTSPKAVIPETFEEAMRRQGLTEEDVQTTKRHYLIFALIFITGAIISAGFFIGYLVNGYFVSSIIALAISLYLMAAAFRYDFWHFQIKHRTLGCTLEDWWRGKPNQQGGRDA